ncbi:hypothetical protein ACU8MT_23395 [Rhizobium leguminosarum]
MTHDVLLWKRRVAMKCPWDPIFGGLGTVAQALFGTRRKEMVMGFEEFKTFLESP